MQIAMDMTLFEKLTILSDAAKYDVACTSSGVDRSGNKTGMGNCLAPGICHTFSADGRCVSLLKILFTNECIFNCAYCLNNCNNDVRRASFTPEEICTITLEFYRRNYIEYLADRMSINLELPTANALKKLAPYKSRRTILKPMRQIQNGITENKEELALYRSAPKFLPAGQSTQMIIGATPENDYQIMSVAEQLYDRFSLKRVFYSAFINVNEDSNLPMLPGGPPLLREHRLYQADWLLRYYHFHVDELLSEARPDFNIYLDPKCDWAVRHLEYFPVEIQKADYRTLLRVPGIGYKSAQRIIRARRHANLGFDDLKRMGVVLKRALYFITCSGRMMYPTKLDEDYIVRNLVSDRTMVPKELRNQGYEQLTLSDILG